MYADGTWRWAVRTDGAGEQKLKAYWTRKPARLTKLTLMVPGEGGTPQEAGSGYLGYGKAGVYTDVADPADYDLRAHTTVPDAAFFTGVLDAGTAGFLGWYTAKEGGTKVVDPDGTPVLTQELKEIPGWMILTENSVVRWIAGDNNGNGYGERVLYAHFSSQ